MSFHPIESVKKHKKGMLILLGVLAVLAVVIGAGVRFLLNRNSGVVSVYSMSLLNQEDFYGYDQELYGTISSDYVQQVFLESGKTVKKIHVKQGDQVKEGDKLLTYDSEEKELDLKLKELEIQREENTLKTMKSQLEQLKKGVWPDGYDESDSDSSSSDSSTTSTDDLSTDSADSDVGTSSLSANSNSAAVSAAATTEAKRKAIKASFDMTGIGKALYGKLVAEGETGGSDTTEASADTETSAGTEASTEAAKDTVRTVITSVEDKSSLSGDGSSTASPYIYLVLSDKSSDGEDQRGTIKGSVINDLVHQGKYAIIRQYASQENYNNNVGPDATVTISPASAFTDSLSTDGYYRISDLNAMAVTVTGITITPSNVTSVKTNSSTTFKVEASGQNISSATIIWTVLNNTSQDTTIDNGVLTVGSDEKVGGTITVKAECGGQTETVKLLVKKGSTKKSSSSGKSSSSSTSSKSSSSGSGSSSGSDDSSDSSDSDDSVTHTKSEISEAAETQEKNVAEKEADIAKLKIEYTELKKEIEEYTVKATMDGTVTIAYTKDSLPQDGSVIIEVRADNGMFVKTSVNEFDLDTVKVGGTIICTSYETNESYEAVVKEIAQFPSTTSNTDSTGNPNSSGYPLVAYIAEADGLTEGEDVSISYNQSTMGSATGEQIIIHKAYIREEGQSDYVYIRGEDKRLKKQYIKTGGIQDGQYVIVESGLTSEDYIAFPYGKNVKEGARTKISQGDGENEIIY